MARFSLWCRGVRTAEVQSGHHHHHHHHIMYRRVMDDDDGGVVCLRSTVRLPLTADHSRHSSGCGWMDVGAVALPLRSRQLAFRLRLRCFGAPFPPRTVSRMVVRCCWRAAADGSCMAVCPSVSCIDGVWSGTRMECIVWSTGSRLDVYYWFWLSARGKASGSCCGLAG